MPQALYLAAGGVGKIAIADADCVSLSNLSRQVLYSKKDIGKNKSLVLSEKLKDLHPESNIIAYDSYLTEENKNILLQGYD